MDLVALARKLALAFADGESNNALSATLQALFPSAAYMRCSAALTDGLGNNMHASLCLCGSNRVAVATSNLAAKGFMTQSLVGVESYPCLMTGRPELVPVSRSSGFVPFRGRLLAGRFVCIPIPTMPAAQLPAGYQISGLVERPGAMIGCLVLGLATERPQDPGLIINAANLVRALAAELPWAAVRAAQSIVGMVIAVSLDDNAAAIAASPSDAAQAQTASGAAAGSGAAAPAAAPPQVQAAAAAAPGDGMAAAAGLTRSGAAASDVGAPTGAAAAAESAAEAAADSSFRRASSGGSSDFGGSLAAGESTAGDTASESSANEHPTPQTASAASDVESDIAIIASLTVESADADPSESDAA